MERNNRINKQINTNNLQRYILKHLFMFRFDLSKQSLPVVGTKSPNVWICMQSPNPIYQLCVASCKLGRTFNSVRTFLVACPDINKLFSSSARHS